MKNLSLNQPFYRTFIFISFFLCTDLIAQESLFFTKAESGLVAGTGLQATRIEANKSGGVFEIRVPSTSNSCYADYQFQWKFLDDISTLVKGKKYRYEMTGRRTGGTCDKNTNIGRVLSSNSYSPLASTLGIKGQGSSIITTSSSSTREIVAQPTPGYLNQITHSFGVIEFKNGSGVTQSFFGFGFEFSTYPYSSGVSKKADFQVLYVYSKTKETASSGPINCGGLYGAGFNIGIMEYASLKDEKSFFLLSFIENAILGAKGSNCVSSSDIAYLEDLKKRVAATERSKIFNAEISSFRQSLAVKVADCGCK